MFVGLLLTLVLSSPQQPARDAGIGKPAPAASGTATISGIVVTDNPDRTPVRRARVSIMDGERRSGATVITDDVGRFAFRNVPAGRYTVTAAKNAWVGIAYGATRPGRPGTPIVVNDGQVVDDLTLRLARGAVITGTLTDQTGRPLPGAMVRTFRYAYQAGTRNLVPAGGGPNAADDRGLYRIFGLAPGQYVVGATVPATMAAPLGEIRQTTDAEIQRALSDRGTSGDSGMPSREARSATVAYAPVFYPGTSVASQASVVTVNVGEERGGIDIQLTLVPTARVEGMVVLPDGAVAANVPVNLLGSDPGVPGFGLETFRTGRTAADGRFTLFGLPPGRYTLTSRAAAAGDPAPPPTAADRLPATSTASLWAMTDVVLDGQHLAGITLTLQPGFTVSGRIAFKGTLPPPDPSRLRVQLMAITTPGQVNLGVSPATIKQDWTFTVTGVAPGAYRIMLSVPNVRPDQAGWTLASATFNGRDVLDASLDVRGSISDGVLTLTDSAAELSGTLQDPSGRPAPEYYIIVFAADRAFWTPFSRRVRMVRPSADGRFTVRPLPPGDYLAAAVTDMEDGEWSDPNVLQQLAAGSMKLTIAEGEKKIQDIQVAVSR